MTEGLSLSRIGQIAVIVRDLPRAVAFYRDVLGMRFLFEFPGMAFFDCGGVRLYLTAATPDVPSMSIIYYRVDRIREAVIELERRGVHFAQGAHKVHEDSAHELWLAFFRDSEDNQLALMSDVPKS